MCRLFSAQRIKILILILCWIDRTDAIFKLTKVECLVDDDSLLRLEYCRLKAVRRDVAEFSARAQLLRPINDVLIRVEYLKYYSGYKPFLINTTLDGCWFLKALKRNKDVGIISLLFNNYSKYTNFNHTCPFEGVLIVDKAYPKHMDLENLPWPTGDYMLKLSFTVQKKLSFRINIGFMFKEIEKFGKSRKGTPTSTAKPKKT